MRRNFIFAFISILLCLVGMSALNPGVKFTITPAAVKNFNDNILPHLVARIQSIKIPDVNEHGVHVQRISINKLSLPSQAIISKFGNNDLVLGTSKFGVEIKAHIEKKILFIKVKSDITATCGDSSVRADITFGIANGHPLIGVRDISVNIKKFHVKMSGGIVSKIVQLVTNIFHGPIQKMASKMISQQLKSKLGEGINKALIRVPDTIAVHDTPLSVAYNLVSAPVATPGYLSVPVEGTFFITSQGKGAFPITPASPRPDYDPALGGQIQVFLNQYMFNSGLYASWKTGLLRFEVSTSLLGSSAGFQMNVGWFKQYVPQIAQQYGDDCRLVFLVEAKDAPTVKLATNNFGIAFTLGVKVSVVSGDQRFDIIDSECVIDVAARVEIQNWVFLPVLTGGQVRSLRVIQTKLAAGSIDENNLKQGYNQLTQATVPRLDISKSAFTLPHSPDAVLVAASFAVKEGYIQIAANPTFKLPANLAELEQLSDESENLEAQGNASDN